MNADQRRVSVVALGASLCVAASLINRWIERRADGGWFAYAPNSGVTFSPGVWWFAKETTVWGIAIAAWFVISHRLLRDRT